MDGEQPESFAELRRLNQDLRGVEGRQVLLDRRLVELDAQVQALQEQHMAQSFAAECGQRAVALGAHRALQTAKEVQEEGEWKKCMEVLGIDSESESQRTAQRMQQELVSVSRRIEEMGERMEVHLAHNVRSGETTRLQARLSALEQSHRKLAVGAQRALRMALSVHEKQEGLEVEEEFARCFSDTGSAGSGLLADIGRLDHTDRFEEQDQRLEQILTIVDALADKVSDTGASVQALTEGQGARSESSAFHEELRDKVEELEGNLYGLAAQVQSQVDHKGRVATLRLMDQQQELALEGLDARLERGLAEVVQKLHIMQDAFDEQQLALRHLAQQLPEVSKRLEQLWAQCQLYFPRLQEQEVHFGFLRASFEAHKQQMLDLIEGLEPKSLLKSWRDKRHKEGDKYGVAAIENPE